MKRMSKRYYTRRQSTETSVQFCEASAPLFSEGARLIRLPDSEHIGRSAVSPSSSPPEFGGMFGKEGSNPTWKESLEDPWSLLYSHKVWLRRIVDNARFAKDVRAEWEKPTYWK